jgi:hypothetical protein
MSHDEFPTRIPFPRREPLTVSKRRASEELDCSVDTIDRLIETGRLRKVQVGPRKVSVIWRSIIDLIEGSAAR